MSGEMGTDDLDVKMSQVKDTLLISVFFSLAFAILLVVFLLRFDIFAVVTNAIFLLASLVNCFRYVSRYRQYRDQFQGLGPSEETSDDS